MSGDATYSRKPKRAVFHWPSALPFEQRMHIAQLLSSCEFKVPQIFAGGTGSRRYRCPRSARNPLGETGRWVMKGPLQRDYIGMQEKVREIGEMLDESDAAPIVVGDARGDDQTCE
jgi:hypothetical protein